MHTNNNEVIDGEGNSKASAVHQQDAVIAGKIAELTDPDNIKSTVNPPITQTAIAAQVAAEVESRGARLAGNLLEQKHSLIEVFTSIVGLVIISLYLTFIVTILCLFLSTKAFTTQLPITGVVILAMTGSIPTILSIFLLIGLFSHKDASKDKEEKGPISEIGSVAKFVAEIAKHMKQIH